MKVILTNKYTRFLTVAFAFVSIIIASSCTTPKDITYFQDRQIGVSVPAVIPNSKPFKLQPGDRISISVKSRNATLSSQFNVSGGSYIIDDNGDIDFPVLGKFHTAGFNRQELVDTLENILRNSNLVNDALVQVEYTGLYVNVLGQGGGRRVNIDKDKMTFFEFLAKIGDLDINAKHKNILVTREEDGVRTQYEIDVTKAETVYNSPVYYLHQNDIVYIEPNDKTKRQATIYSEISQYWSFWTGIASMFVSIYSLVNSFR